MRPCSILLGLSLVRKTNTQISAHIQGRCQDVWSLMGFSHVEGTKEALEGRAEHGIKETDPTGHMEERRVFQERKTACTEVQKKGSREGIGTTVRKTIGSDLMAHR